jgi:FixJ family two-component response regulator
VIANTPTVFLIDDNDSFLRGVARQLRAHGFLVSTNSSATEFLSRDLTDVRGCVVADLQMPGMTGIELQNALSKTENPLPIVFLTGHGDIPTSVSAMRNGAEDFMTKTAPRKELLAAVRRALARDESDHRLRSRRRDLQRRFDTLTPRDTEVLVHVLRGQLNKQIASDLGIDERSVKRHRTSLMRKLQVQSVAELSHLAHEAGIVDSEWVTDAAGANSTATNP